MALLFYISQTNAHWYVGAMRLTACFPTAVCGIGNFRKAAALSGVCLPRAPRCQGQNSGSSLNCYIRDLRKLCSSLYRRYTSLTTGSLWYSWEE